MFVNSEYFAVSHLAQTIRTLLANGLQYKHLVYNFWHYKKLVIIWHKPDVTPVYLNTSRFKDIPSVTPNDTDKFSWNPCTPFCEVHCEGAAVS